VKGFAIRVDQGSISLLTYHVSRVTRGKQAIGPGFDDDRSALAPPGILASGRRSPRRWLY